MVAGTIRFEKRVYDNYGAIKVATVLGQMSYTDSWNCFCELSALGIQEFTSAAVVAESDEVIIKVIPASVFYEFIANNKGFEVGFYKMLSKKLAGILSVLHKREYNLVSNDIMQSTLPAIRIQNETVVYYWPATMKNAIGKSEGGLCLSASYVSFVKRKHERKGAQLDTADVKAIEMELSSIVETTFTKGKLVIKAAGRKDTIAITLEKGVKDSQVLEILSLARKAAQANSGGGGKLKKSEEGKGRRGGLRCCLSCKEPYCANCRGLSALKNRCSNGDSHTYDERSAFKSGGGKPVVCGRCGNEGTHVLNPKDLAMLKKLCTIKEYKPNEEIISVGVVPKVIHYVLEGDCVPIVEVNKEEKLLGQVSAGEVVGEIGFILGSPASAKVIAGINGCTMMELSEDAIKKGNQGSTEEFMAKLYESILVLMWSRITKQEDSQVKTWTKGVATKALSMEERFLSESLLRGETGTKIDERAQSGWY